MGPVSVMAPHGASPFRIRRTGKFIFWDDGFTQQHPNEIIALFCYVVVDQYLTRLFSNKVKKMDSSCYGHDMIAAVIIVIHI